MTSEKIESMKNDLNNFRDLILTLKREKKTIDKNLKEIRRLKNECKEAIKQELKVNG